jgi:hypothetical protein
MDKIIAAEGLAIIRYGGRNNLVLAAYARKNKSAS